MQAATDQCVQKRVLIDLDRCIECGSCAAACHFSHANISSAHQARGGWALLPMICRQCKAAPCVEVCPVEAMIRDEQGVVRRRLLLCIGCGSCVRACPFGVIPNELAGIPVAAKSLDRMTGHQSAKCDLCVDRAGDYEGDETVPRCVAACPSGALAFADEHEASELGLEIVGGRSTAQHPFKRR